jgi:hypothetical protein
LPPLTAAAACCCLLCVQMAAAAHRCRCRCRCLLCVQMAAAAADDKKPSTIADVPRINIGNIIRTGQILQKMAQDPVYRQAYQEDTDTVAQEVVIVYNHLAAIFRAPAEPNVTAPATTTPSAEPVDAPARPAKKAKVRPHTVH